MLYLIGIGLNKESISIEGLEAIKKSSEVYLDNYTSKLNCDKKELEKLYNKNIILANREFVESDKILEIAKGKNIALLIIGDVFSATTHISLFLEAKKRNIEVKVIHGSSVLTAIGITGLQLYKFGRTASLAFKEKGSTKEVYEIIKENFDRGLHTLILLDLEPKENKFMKISEAINILLENKGKYFNENTLCVGCTSLGNNNFEVKFGKAKELLKYKFSKIPQCLIVLGNLHFMEEESLKLWK